MKALTRLAVGVLWVIATSSKAGAQSPEVKISSDTIAVQSEGRFAADPDLATLEFSVSTQDKDLKRAYGAAAQSVQRIVDLAQKNGVPREDVTTGVLTVVPQYDGGRNRRARAYAVDGSVTLRLRDFSRIGGVIDEAIQDGITDFRSLTYSLADEEAAKRNAVAEAMRRAAGRASVALEQRNQKLGQLRYASLDVREITGVSRIAMPVFASTMAVEVDSSSSGYATPSQNRRLPPPLPNTRPEKINVTATVQCVYQIQ